MGRMKFKIEYKAEVKKRTSFSWCFPIPVSFVGPSMLQPRKKYKIIVEEIE